MWAALDDDMHVALRALRRGWFTVVLTCVALGLGVGGNTALVARVWRLAFAVPEGVVEPSRLVLVAPVTDYQAFVRLDSEYPLAVAAYTTVRVSLGTGPSAEPLVLQCVAGPYFEVLGARPLRGATYPLGSQNSGEREAPNVVLSFSFAARQFGGVDEALGRTFPIGDRAFAVVGVMPERFTGLGMKPVDAWVGLTAAPRLCSFTGEDLLGVSRGAWLTTIGRLPPGMNLVQAEAAVRSWHTRAREASHTVNREPLLRPLYRSTIVDLSEEGRLLLWLLAAAGGTLLTAFLTVLGFLLVSAADRQAEMTIRRQLGAGLNRLARSALIEAGIVAGGAALISAAFFVAIDRVIVTEPHRPMATATIVAVAAIAALLASIASLVSFAAATRGDLRMSVAVPSGVPPVGARIRRIALAAQTAMGVILLLASSLFATALRNALDRPGYSIDDVMIVTVDLKRLGRSNAEIHAAFRELTARVRRLDSVRAVATSSAPLLDVESPTTMMPVRAFGGHSMEMVLVHAVTGTFFEALGTPLVSGVTFDGPEQDRPVAIVDAQLARMLWGDQDPQGECLIVGLKESGCLRVVGVSRPRRQVSLSVAMPELFVPLQGRSAETLALVPTTLFVRLRPGTNLGAAKGQLVQVVRSWSAKAGMPYAEIIPVAALVDRATRLWRIGMSVSRTFAALSILLVAVGLYAMLTLALRQRQHDVAICLALGAPLYRAAAFVFRRESMWAIGGAMLGLGAFPSFAASLRRLVHGVSDVALLAYVQVLLVVVGCWVLAMVGPVRRLLGSDISEALREE